MTSASHAEGRQFDPGQVYFLELEEAGATAGARHSLQTRATVVYAAIAQLGERQTEDLKVPGSIPGLGIYLVQMLRRTRVSGAWFRSTDLWVMSPTR